MSAPQPCSLWSARVATPGSMARACWTTRRCCIEPDSQPQIWLESPFRHMLVNDVPELRRPLVGADAVHDFPVLGEFAGEGYTEWLGLSYSFGWDLQRADEDFRNPGMGMKIGRAHV